MMSITSPFFCRVGGRAGDDEVDAKALFGCVLGADEVGVDLDADEVGADLGAEDVGA